MAKQPVRVILPVEGMHCASCVAKIEGALKGLAGVRAVSVHLPSKTAAVEYDPELARTDALRRAVESQGYRVPGIAATYQQAEELLYSADAREGAVLLRRVLVGAAVWLILLLERPLGLSEYSAWALATPLQFWAGWHFHKGFLAALRAGRADMNTLVSISTWSMYLFSAWNVIYPKNLMRASEMHMFESLAGLIVMVSLGRWLETRFRKRASSALRKLLRMAPKTVRALRGGVETVVPLPDVTPGETIWVGPGEAVGLDGIVEEGASAVDESMLTGESIPVEKSPGAQVFGGTINKTGILVVRVTRTGSEMSLAKIIEAVRASVASKAPIQKAADKVAGHFVPVVILLAVASAIVWSWKGPAPQVFYALTAFVSVLSVACPCALGLATPMAVLIGTGRAAELGILLRNAEVLDKAGRLDVAILDKTGTLTEGRPSVVRLLPASGIGEEELLRWAMTAELRSEHPFAEALRARASAGGIAPEPVEAFEAFPGRGVAVMSRSRRIWAGSLSWLAERGIPAEPEVVEALLRTAGSVLGVAVEEKFAGAVVLDDRVRDHAREAVVQLEKMGLEVILASGDRNAAVHRVAEAVGIERVYAEVLPQEKARIVRELQEGGKRVAMVGEGFNDAPALSQADVGVALATGTDIAAESSDITLMKPDLRHFVTALLLSRRIRRVIYENLAWAFAYNIVLLPVAAGALYPSFGILLKPHHAGAAMALSSISVVLNSMKLRKFRP
ncbi:MAG: copper-translocating P-type ATPase [Elusimicrobia bacterium]|nr:copper-translocating P-type ATPase [Elusimicrobiota bacterium]